MERIINDIQVYANTVIDSLIRVKDYHRDVLNSTEIDAINDAANLISHNIQELKHE